MFRFKKAGLSFQIFELFLTACTRSPLHVRHFRGNKIFFVKVTDCQRHPFEFLDKVLFFEFGFHTKINVFLCQRAVDRVGVSFDKTIFFKIQKLLHELVVELKQMQFRV